MTDSDAANVEKPWRRPATPTEPQVVIPRMCPRHERDVTRRLRLTQNDPWMATLTVVQILLFTWTTADVRFHRRTEGDLKNMSLILAEMGCMACVHGDGFTKAIGLIRDRGLGHAAAVSQNEVADELWPIQRRIDAMDAIVRPGGEHGEAQKD